jgi:acetyl esterase
MNAPILEGAAQEIADATSKPPFLYELGVEGARKVLDDIQAAPVEKLDVDEKWITVPAQVGEVLSPSHLSNREQGSPNDQVR